MNNLFEDVYGLKAEWRLLQLGDEIRISSRGGDNIDILRKSSESLFLECTPNSNSGFFHLQEAQKFVAITNIILAPFNRQLRYCGVFEGDDDAWDESKETKLDDNDPEYLEHRVEDEELESYIFSPYNEERKRYLKFIVQAV